MRSVSTLVLALALVGLMCFASPASATIIWDDDLETATVGSSLTSRTPPVGIQYSSATGTVADWTTDPAPGATNPGKFGTLPDVTNNTFLENNLGYTETLVKTTLDIYVPTGSGVDYRGMMVRIKGGDNTSFAALLYPSNGDILVYKPGWDYGIVGTFTRDAWIPIEVVADYVAQTYTATIDGVTWSDGFVDTTAYQGGILIGHANAGFQAQMQYFDNVLVEAIPEPSTLALLATGLIGLLCYAWRKRK